MLARRCRTSTLVLFTALRICLEMPFRLIRLHPLSSAIPFYSVCNCVSFGSKLLFVLIFFFFQILFKSLKRSHLLLNLIIRFMKRNNFRTMLIDFHCFFMRNKYLTSLTRVSFRNSWIITF